MKKIKGINSIITMFNEADACDKALFADMRTNIMLRNGKHYSKTTSSVARNLRAKNVISDTERIKITKNHIHRITNDYINSIGSRNPSSVCMPYNKSDLADIKDAEISNSVLTDIKLKNNWKKTRRGFITDQVTVGEAYAIAKFDYAKGDMKKDEITGQEYPIGQVVIEKRMGFECKRDPSATSFEDSRYLFFDKLVDKEDAKAIVDVLKPEKSSQLVDSFEKSNTVAFDFNSASYSSESKRTLFIEMFIRPCAQYPKGQYILSTKEFIIHEMELPLGIFPVYQLGFDPLQTTPRCASIVNVAKPYQAEINRASSKQVEHQITIGDDKIFIDPSSKVTDGGKKHGVRIVKAHGKPTILEGRTGEQYAKFVKDQIAEMYEAVNLPHLISDLAVSERAGDPYALLYKTMSQGSIYSYYLEAYESFESDLFRDCIKLAKHYYTVDHVIKITGKKEAVNIPEFKDASDDGFDIKVEESNGDIESKFGKMMMLTNILQYAGSSLDKDQLGQLIKEMPYANKDRVFNSLTSNTELVENILLALDRGEQPMLPKYANTEMILQALTNRTVQADFTSLDQQVQVAYFEYIQMLEQQLAQKQMQMQQANMGMIPTGGTLITINSSWKNPSTGKVERLKMPSKTIEYMAEKLNQQGLYAQQMQHQGDQVQLDVNNMVAQQMPPQQQPVPQGQGF